MSTKFKRLSVAVDETIVEILDKLTTSEGKTVSDIIRESILAYAEVISGGAKISDLKHYEELIERRDHVFVDLEIWIAILDFINAKADDEFWKLIENIGYEMGVEFRLRNMHIRDLLRHFQFKNILNFTEENGVYILTLVSRSATNMILRMLKGAFAAMNVETEIIPGVRKIVLVDKKKVKEKDLENWISEMGKTFESSDWPVW